MPLIPRLRRSRTIAVIEMHGAIGTRLRESEYAKLFTQVERNDRFRALVLDIESPGGSASASESMHHGLVKVAAKKPVVAYIRGLGASGGYYIACGAHKVTAMPSTLVGSIGVIHLRPILEQLLGRVGVEFSVVKGGHMKDMGGFWRGPTDEESAKLEGLITEIYDNFVNVVAAGRQMEQDQVRELATGELFTARQGKELGLVDELCDFDQSLQMAAQMAGIDGRKARPRHLRPRRTLSEKLTGRPSNRSAAASLLGPELMPLLHGGVYYQDPTSLLGSP